MPKRKNIKMSKRKHAKTPKTQRCLLESNWLRIRRGGAGESDSLLESNWLRTRREGEGGRDGLTGRAHIEAGVSADFLIECAYAACSSLERNMPHMPTSSGTIQSVHTGVTLPGRGHRGTGDGAGRW